MSPNGDLAVGSEDINWVDKFLVDILYNRFDRFGENFAVCEGDWTYIGRGQVGNSG